MEFILPTDVIIADKFAEDADSKVVAVDSIPEGWMVTSHPISISLAFETLYTKGYFGKVKISELIHICLQVSAQAMLYSVACFCLASTCIACKFAQSVCKVHSLQARTIQYVLKCFLQIFKYIAKLPLACIDSGIVSIMFHNTGSHGRHPGYFTFSLFAASNQLNCQVVTFYPY